MKKRLRKKKHKGEFAIFGRQVVIRRNTRDGFDGFLDYFIEAVEAQDCVCGGGGKDELLDAIVELGRRDQRPDERMRAIEDALRKEPSVASIEIGPEFDLRYGNPRDLTETDGAG